MDQPTELTGQQEYTLDGEKLFHMISGQSLRDSDFFFENLICNWPKCRRKKRYTAAFGPHFCQQWSRRSNYSFTCTDPEYLLFVKTV